MTRYLLKISNYYLMLAFHGVMAFGCAAGLNYLYPRAGFLVTILYGLLFLFVLIDLIGRIFTQGRWALSMLPMYELALGGLIGSSFAFLPEEHPSSQYFGSIYWFNLLIAPGIAAAACCFLMYLLRMQWRPLFRILLTAKIREAIVEWRDSFKERQAIIKHALADFKNEIQVIVRDAEARGDQSIQLTFQEEDGTISYGMDYHDLGWPKGWWGTECTSLKFVDRARLAAQTEGLSAEVILTDDKTCFCLDLRW